VFLPRPGQSSVYNTFSQTFYYDGALPTGAIIFPTNNTTIGSSTYTVVVRADSTVTGVMFNLQDSNSNNDDIVISGLWAIEFDNRAPNELGTTTTALPVVGGSTTLTSTGPALFFSAGINNYADGLFGTLTPTPAQLNAEDHE